MFRNYLLIALRKLAKHRDYALLNSLGLGLTVACCLLIFLLVRHQLSFDSFHPKSGQIGRVVTALHMENVRYSSSVPYPMANALGWWTMNKWLADFAYHIDIGWPVLALTGALTVVVAVLTVGFQSVKAALANPTESLRSE